MGTLKTTAGGLTLTGGTLNVTTNGVAESSGLWINGGTVTVAGGTLNANSGYTTVNGGGTLAVSSGTCNITTTELLNAFGGAGTVTVSGSGVLNVNILRVAQAAVGTVNLNGGTLQLNRFNYGSGTGTVNFNGGTVQAKSAQPAFTYVSPNMTYNVSTNGAIFDTVANNITIGSPLVHDSTLGATLDGGLTKNGSGTLTLAGANTYTGGTTNSAGFLEADKNNAFGTGLLTMNGGTLTNNVASITLTNPISLAAASSTVGVGGGTALTLTGVITNSGSGTNLFKAGAGTLVLNPGVGNTDSVSNLVVAAGTNLVTGGTVTVLASGSANNGTAGTGLTISGASSVMTVAGGTVNTTGYASINGGGTLTVNSGTFNETGGELLNAFGSAGTINLNGGVMAVSQLRVGHTAGQGTVNLNGGTLQTSYINNAGAGGTLNLNGSTIKPTANSTSFMGIINTYKVQAGGAIFDTAGFTITNGSPLIHDAALGATLDGGLTKNGNGTLVLSATNTYSGATTVSGGTLALGGSGSLASTNLSVVPNATFAVSGISPASYTLPAGILTLSLNKTGVSLTQGQMALGAKTLAYAGALNVVSNANSDLFVAGNSFTLFVTNGTPGQLSGWFSSVTLPALSSGLAWDTNHLAAAGILDVYTFTTTPLTVATLTNTPTTILAAKLASHASSSKAGAAYPTGWTASAAGATLGTVSFSNGDLIYTSGGTAGTDNFTVTFFDGHGSQTMAVSVTVSLANVGPALSVDNRYSSNGGFGSFTASGIPGQTYNVQWASSVNGPWTNAINPTVTAASNGLIDFTDTQTISAYGGTVFYRLQQ